MFESIRKYLFLYKKLQLPGIGTFIIEHIPARIDNTLHLIYSPMPIIRFNNDETKADKHFFDFLATDLKIAELDAVKNFSDLIFKYKNELNKTNTLPLDGIGTLTKDLNNVYYFSPDNNLQEILPEIPAVRVSSAIEQAMKENSETIEYKEEYDDSIEAAQKGRWWIYALILAILGSAAIVYYYYFYKPF